MSDYRDQLLAAIRATQIHSRTRFSWFGERSPPLPRRLNRVLSAKAQRDHLRSSLALRLYADFYCTGGARPQSNAIAIAFPRSAGMQLASLLSGANRGQGRWEEGWEAGAVDEQLVSLRRGGFCIQARRSDDRVLLPSASGADARASLRRPKELFNSSPGFYLALGDREPAPHSRILRLYFDVSPSAAVGLTREITSRFNDHGLPFRLKVLNDVGAFTRCDCMVLYVGQEDFPGVRSVLEKLYPSLESQLRGRTPALARVLAPGIGLAEDPPGGQSFGLHRCSLVAEGLIDAWEANASSSGERLAIVAARFELEGVDIDAPYLGPASNTDYSFDPQGTGALAIHAAGESCSPHDFLRMAEEIARGLIGKALWHRDCCNWLGSTPAETINSDSPSARIFAALGPDLYLGTSGIALFLASLWRATGSEDRRLQRTAMGAIRHALMHSQSLGPRDTLGLYTGRMGIIFACARVGWLLESDELSERAAALSAQPLDLSAKDLPFDLMSGRAGAIIALLSMQALRTRSALVELAGRLGDQLIASAQECQGGWAWPSHSSTQRRLLTGFSHGVAGIGCSLLELFRHTGERRYRHAAEQAFRYERRWFNAEKGNWVDLRDNDGKREHFGEFGYPAQWCHGAPGIALSRVRAHAILEDEPCLAEARVALATTQRSVESALRDGEVNYSLCHGIAGNADVLLIGASALDDGGSKAIATAKMVGSVGISKFGNSGGSWPLGARGEVPGVMLGLAGIGHFYLRLFDSRVPSFLMWRPEDLSKEKREHAPEAPADACAAGPAGERSPLVRAQHSRNRRSGTSTST